MLNDKSPNSLKKILEKYHIQKEKNLFPYLSMRLDIYAQFFCEIKTKKDWLNTIKLSKYLKLPIIILGGGSNVVSYNKNIKALVVLDRFIKKEIINKTEKFIDIKVSSGYPLSKLVRDLTSLGYEGLEYFWGIPGTVGGALSMNSKWTKPTCFIRDRLIKSFFLTKNGNIKEVSGYNTVKGENNILLEAILRFNKKNIFSLDKISKDVMAYRQKTQPQGIATCGCFFKNTVSKPAGYLIDKAGLKGISIGGFSVSKKHANFIVNEKGKESNPKDLKSLASLIKKCVKEKFGVELEEEVVVI